MMREAAQARKAEYLSTPALRDKLLAGDVATKKDWSSVNATLASTMPDPNVVAREATAATWKDRADLPPEALAQFVKGEPVFESEREQALRTKQQLFRDRAWVSKYLDGDRAAASTMAHISLIISSPTKPDLK
jgi:hypothetical protein